MAKIRVLIIDDSALVRSLLTEIINRESDMEVVGAAPDPLVARQLIRSLNPDVLTLDIEMPKMDGIDFLEKIMTLRPMPVVMVSTLTAKGAAITLKALELGAVDFVAKPRIGIATGMQDSAREIVEKIRIASCAKIRRNAHAKADAQPVHAESGVALAVAGGGHVAHLHDRIDDADHGASVAVKKPVFTARHGGTEKLLLIGASTGGTEAIRELLQQLPPDSPAVLVTQHMPPGFTRNFAERLDRLCRISVKEAEDGERILPGHAYIAPGGRHLAIDRSGANYVVKIEDGEPINRHKPSVEVLFRSGARFAGANSMGVILTGMGKDGAQGLLEMKKAGSYNFAQDEATCVVFGMPREAIALGAVDEVLSVPQIAGRVLERLANSTDHRIRI